MYKQIKYLLITSFFFAAQVSAVAQTDAPKTKAIPKYPMDKLSLGIGVGLDYGGLGCNLTFYPQKNIGVFAGIGYGLIQLGYNVGLKTRLTFNKNKPQASVYALGMYGYNTVFKIKGATSLNRMYYGPSVGIGVETAVKPNKVGFWSFGILIPIRSQEALDYYDQLKRKSSIQFDNDLLPFALSVGFKCNIR